MSPHAPAHVAWQQRVHQLHGEARNKRARPPKVPDWLRLEKTVFPRGKSVGAFVALVADNCAKRLRALDFRGAKGR
jgi:hypothetical protein